MAKRRGYTPEHIACKLREVDRLFSEGAVIADVARHLEVSEQTFRRWRNQYGGFNADDVQRLKSLEVENAPLKRIVADKKLEIDALRDISDLAAAEVSVTDILRSRDLTSDWFREPCAFCCGGPAM